MPEPSYAELLEAQLPPPDPNQMSSHELLVELVINMRELKALIEPLLRDPASLFTGMGPGGMAQIMAGMFGGGRGATRPGNGS